MNMFEIEREYMFMFECVCWCIFNVLVEMYLSKGGYISSCVRVWDWMNVWLSHLICVFVNVCMNVSVYDCVYTFVCLSLFLYLHSFLRFCVFICVWYISIYMQTFLKIIILFIYISAFVYVWNIVFPFFCKYMHLNLFLLNALFICKTFCLYFCVLHYQTFLY